MELESKRENRVGQENRHWVRDMYPLHTQRGGSICREEKLLRLSIGDMQRKKIQFLSPIGGPDEANRR
jgi:hypothetical protein